MAESSDRIAISLISEEDVPPCYQVMSESFGHSAPFVDIYFPNHDTPSGRIQGSERLTTWVRTSKDSAFLKAVARNSQSDEERIIGLAIWTLMTEPPPAKLDEVEDVEELWPDKDDREYMTLLWRDYVVPRSQAILDSNGKGVYVLELLAVHPDYQRLGAGTALVKWGTHAADDKRVAVVVESTPWAAQLYERCGLRTVIEEMHFDAGEKFRGRRNPLLTFLKRDARV